jgi:hypothetical protein
MRRGLESAMWAGVALLAVATAVGPVVLIYLRVVV